MGIRLLLACGMMFLAACGNKTSNATNDNISNNNNLNSNDMDTFKTKNGKTVKFTPIKHASMEINFDGCIKLSDERQRFLCICGF